MKSSYIDDKTLLRLKKATNPVRWLPLWLSVETGLRIGDVVSLKWENVSRDLITFTASKTKKSGTARISRALFVALCATKTSSPWCFPSPKDSSKHIRRETAWHRIKSACKRAGIDAAGISPHTMRKVFAVELFKRAGMKATQEALQHDKASTTEIYALSDFSTGDNAALPLTRGDIPLIIEMVVAALKNRA